MSDIKHIKITPKLQEQIDAEVRKAKGSAAVEAMIEQRLSHRDATENKAGWGAYQRYLLSDGHTIFVNLSGKELTATKSEKPARQDGAAIRKYKARLRRQEKEVAKAAKAEQPVTVKAKTTKPKAKRSKKPVHEPVYAELRNETEKEMLGTKKAVVDPLTQRKPEPVQA